MALQRAEHPMPDDVLAALRDRGLEQQYAERPPYQRNDYLGWIARAKRDATRRKRVDQMLDELERGGVYMNMKWSGPRERPDMP
ncbi:MAG: YdeI/OmpD-associated family protein [Dehalococcoidia bacterium]